MSTQPTAGARPHIEPGMRLEWRVRELRGRPSPCRSHSSVLVRRDGEEVCTIATDDRQAIRAAIAKAEGKQ